MFLNLDPRLTAAPTFTVWRSGSVIGSYRGIQDHDDMGDFIDFIYPNNIVVEDKIVTISGKEYFVTGIDRPRSLGGLSTMRYFKVYFKEISAKSPLVNNTINITNNNSAVFDNNIDISIVIQNVQNNIEKMGSLSEEETKSALAKVNELAEIIKSKENRKQKWNKVASVFKWLAEKSVDLACAFSPIIVQSLSALK